MAEWGYQPTIPHADFGARIVVAASTRLFGEAIELVAQKRDGDGLWPLETRYPGAMPVEMDEGEGQPSRWNTLRAPVGSGTVVERARDEWHSVERLRSCLEDGRPLGSRPHERVAIS